MEKYAELCMHGYSLQQSEKVFPSINIRYISWEQTIADWKQEWGVYNMYSLQNVHFL